MSISKTLVAGLAILAAGALPQMAHAQTAPAASAATPTMSLPAMRFDRLAARDVAAQLVKATAGEARVFVDRTTAGATVTCEVPAGPLPQALARLAESLPKGTIVKMTLLPASASTLAGDTIADYIATEEALRKASGAPNAANGGAGTAVVLGQAVSPEAAASVVTALGLKPVYLLTNPSLAPDPVVRMTSLQEDALRSWQSMTPQQREAAAERQFETLLSMDPDTRRALFQQQGQMMQKMMQKFQTLPEGSRQAFWNDLMGGLTGGRANIPLPQRREAGGGSAGGSPQ